MDDPRNAGVVERHFLNLPRFHTGAYVRAYVQDTSDQEVGPSDGSRPACVPHTRFDLEIADCDRVVKMMGGLLFERAALHAAAAATLNLDELVDHEVQCRLGRLGCDGDDVAYDGAGEVLEIHPGLVVMPDESGRESQRRIRNSACGFRTRATSW